MNVEKRLLDITAAAECMSMSEDAVYDEIKAGRLPKVHLRKKILVPVVGIDWYIDTYAELGGEIWRSVVDDAMAKARSTVEPTDDGSPRRLSIVDEKRG